MTLWIMMFQKMMMSMLMIIIMIMMIKFNHNNYDIDATDDNNVNDWKMMILQMIFLEKPLIKMKNPTLCHSFRYVLLVNIYDNITLQEQTRTINCGYFINSNFLTSSIYVSICFGAVNNWILISDLHSRLLLFSFFVFHWFYYEH